MLSDRIKIALSTLDVTITEVARAGGCTPSNLNRVKNGVRTPPPTSPTIQWLTEGLIRIAAHRELSGELRILCGAKLRDNDESLRARLISWLYEDEPPYVRSYHKQKDSESEEGYPDSPSFTAFSKRLDRLMKTIGFSNRRLGKTAGIDPSYISRLRRGKRIPRYRSPYLAQICTAFWNTIVAEERLSDVAELTANPSIDLLQKDGADGLRRWLFGYGTVTGHLAAEELMKTIASIDKLIEAAHIESEREYDIEKIIEDSRKKDNGTDPPNEQRYVGISGIRSAVTRFLAEMIQNGEQKMFLYSDQRMGWMDGEYRLVLKALMMELIRRDVTIHIIHTVDRSMPELVSAVEWWMPLYLSGKISSFYCRNSAGKRFSHTLFIRPDAACIAGTSAIGLEHRSVYHYSTDHDMTALAEDTFNSIMKESLPLVQIRQFNGDVSEDDGFIRTGHVTVKASPKEVSIRRTEPPYLTFTFTHPMICRAFRLYMEPYKHFDP